jgi:membrane protein
MTGIRMKWMNKDFFQEIYKIWITEKPTQLAAALAYFGIFSFAAVIYIAYRVAGIFINEVAAAERLYTRLETVLGPETVAFIQEKVTSISTADTGGSLIVTTVSFLSLLYVAMGLFMQLKYALNRIWGVPLIQIGKKFAFLRQELFAFIMLIILGLAVILATMINVVFAWFGTIINDLIGGSTLLSIFNILALLGVIVLTNAFTYKILPDVKITWHDVWLGAMTATLLTALGGLVIGLYFSLGGVHSAFEAAGAFAVLMIAIYYFAQIFLFGAVVTRVYAHRYGSKRDML